MLKYLIKIFDSLIARAVSKFRRYTVVVNRKVFRASSAPYVSGDTLRKCSNFIFDETKSFKPQDVNNNDIIFLKADLKEVYFSTIHPRIDSKYILITHNSDQNIQEEDKKFFDHKLIHWFAQNLTFSADEKFSPVPIGFENRFYLNNGKLRNLKFIDRDEKIKENKILASFNVNTNYYSRDYLFRKLGSFDNVEQIQFSTPVEYLMNLKSYKFIICPEGNGKDTHRIWEGLLTKTVPIVLNSEFTKNLKNLGIPLLIIDNWDELNNFSSDYIANKYDYFANYNFRDFVTIDYWLKKVAEKNVI